MRAVSVAEEAIVVTSLFEQTNATAIRADGETLLIDSPYHPEELELLPALLKQAGFEPVALLATHRHFDHLLGRAAFPALSLGVAESTMRTFRSEPGVAQRELRDYDSRNYIERAPLALGNTQALPVPGRLGLGEQELELHAADGHTADGMLVFAPWLGLLCCGDYNSDVEIPWLSRDGSLADYRSTLKTLAGLLDRATTIVPGHGRPHDAETAKRLLEEDIAYLDQVEAGAEKPSLPDGRDTSFQRWIHRENLKVI